MTSLNVTECVGKGSRGLHCIDCPAVRRDVLGALIGHDAQDCRFDTRAIEARERLPQELFARPSVAIVRRGLVIRERVDHHGRMTAVDVAGPGGVFCVDADDAAQGRSSAYAVTRALVCRCPMPEVEAALLGDDRKGAMDLFKLQGEAVLRVERLSDARGRGTAAAKVAALLCVLSDTLRTNAPGGRIPPGFLQRDLAALLSIRHESVCRVMRDLQKRGLVMQDADGIQLLDRPALEAV